MPFYNFFCLECKKSFEVHIEIKHLEDWKNEKVLVFCKHCASSNVVHSVEGNVRKMKF